MKTLLIVICCLLLVDWVLGSSVFHVTTVRWDYNLPYFMSDVISSGMIIFIGLLIAVGLMLGTAAVVGTALFFAVAVVLCTLVSALWPFVLIGVLIVLCSSKKGRGYQ